MKIKKIRIWKTTKRISVTKYHHSTDLDGEGVVVEVGDEWYEWLKKAQPSSGYDEYQNLLWAEYQSSNHEKSIG